MTTLNEDRTARREAEVQTTLQPGAIAVSTWGYDQTNVDFYVVLDRKVRKDGSTWVQVQRIYSVQTPDDGAFMQYHAVPFLSAVKRQTQVDDHHKPMWRKVSQSDHFGESFGPESYSFARPWNGRPVRGSSYA